MRSEQLGESTSGLAGWVIDVIETIGVAGVGALIFLETVFPPIPSEVILPFAGFSASLGTVNLVWAWVFATVGSVLGAWLLYGVGALVGLDRIEVLATKRWFLLFGPGDLARGERIFARYGDRMVLFGRCVPLVRSIVSVPAGLERMPLLRFTLLTTVGSGVWNAIFIGAGYQLGNRWDVIEGWIQPVSYAVVALFGMAGLGLGARKVRAVRAARATAS